MSEEKRKTAVYILRVGEKEDNNDPDSGLSEEGRKYIADLARFEFSKLPFEAIYHSPSNVARETVKTFIGGAQEFVFTPGFRVEEREEIFADREKWNKVIAGFSGVIKTLADLQKAQEIAVERGFSEVGFIYKEGERIFQFIVGVEKDLRDDGVLLCITHSPLPEAMILWFLETKMSPEVRRWRGLNAFEMLDYLDGYALLFNRGQLETVVGRKFKEKVKIAMAREEHERELTQKFLQKKS